MLSILQSLIQELLLGVYWLEIIIFLVLIAFTLFLEKQYKIKKPRKWFLGFHATIWKRILSVVAYYIPYLDMINTHVPLIAEEHPYIIRLFLPNFITESLEIVQRVPFLPFIYLMVGYGVLIRNKIPRDRLVRFNIMYGIMIISFQGILNELFLNFTRIFCFDSTDRSEAALFVFLMWLSVFVPCFWRAIRGKYENNQFMREAIEVHLGRDGPDFVWWDRVNDGKRPKK